MSYQAIDTDTGCVVRWHALRTNLEQWVLRMNESEGRTRYALEVTP